MRNKTQMLPRSEKSGGKRGLFSRKEMSGNLAVSQGNSKFLVKVSEKSGNFIISLLQGPITIIFFRARQFPFIKSLIIRLAFEFFCKFTTKGFILPGQWKVRECWDKRNDLDNKKKN